MCDEKVVASTFTDGRYGVCVVLILPTIERTHPDIATCNFDLAYCLAATGQLTRAEPFLRCALQLRLRSVTDQRPHVDYPGVTLTQSPPGSVTIATPLVSLVERFVRALPLQGDAVSCLCDPSMLVMEYDEWFWWTGGGL